MNQPTYAKDGFDAVDQWALDNEVSWLLTTRECQYRHMTETQRLQLLASEMLDGMRRYRDLAMRVDRNPPAPELETARACVKHLRATLRMEKEEHARTLAELSKLRLEASRKEKETNIFDKLFR